MECNDNKAYKTWMFVDMILMWKNEVLDLFIMMSNCGYIFPTMAFIYKDIEQIARTCKGQQKCSYRFSDDRPNSYLQNNLLDMSTTCGTLVEGDTLSSYTIVIIICVMLVNEICINLVRRVVKAFHHHTAVILNNQEQE